MLAAAQPKPAAPPPLRVAAASDLQPVLPVLVEAFRRDTGHRVDVSFGSSGNFFAQLQNGAPFDVFLSADVEYPKRLESAGLADGVLEYARGRLVLWTRNDSGLDPGRGLALLGDAGVRRIAIANPEHAPYGRAAVASLRHEQLYDRVRSKLVLGENISQAAQFAQSGNAEVGLIALSLARAPAMRATGRYVEIPEALHPPITQAAVVLRSSKQQDAARQFLAFMSRPDTGKALVEAGFVVPQSRR